MASEHEDENTVRGSRVTPSPSGNLIAFIKERTLCCSQIFNTGVTNFIAPITLRPADITSVQWSENEQRILVASGDGAEVFEYHRNDKNATCKIDNGSGGLGQLASVDFISDDQLVSTWEFGKTRIWNLRLGSSDELPDVKTTCDGNARRSRPRLDQTQPHLLAMISRNGSEDQLVLYLPLQNTLLALTKLPTVDAQNLSWSPDGRWLMIQDAATASPSLYFYTPDGHPFRTYPSTSDPIAGLGIKSTTWSPDNRFLALAKYDGRIELLNTRTFSALAIVTHTPTIDQRSLSPEQRAPIWQETISASGVHSYTLASQPISPPTSQPKPNPEPNDHGVAEQAFNCDGTLLATRSCHMLNTIWLWRCSSAHTSFSPHAVLLQHRSVRRMRWHPAEPHLLLIDAALPATANDDHVLHVFDATALHPPRVLPIGLKPKPTLSWLRTPRDTKPIILVAAKHTFRFLYPDGEPARHRTGKISSTAPRTSNQNVTTEAREGADDGDEDEEAEDSLFEILSNRKPLPPKTELSYTEQVDWDVNAADDGTATMMTGVGLEDTFREKKRVMAAAQAEVDPFEDDSEIF